MNHNAENRDAYVRANTGRSALFCYFYELTIAQAYLAEDMHATAVFELAFRTLPATRNYVMGVSERAGDSNHRAHDRRGNWRRHGF